MQKTIIPAAMGGALFVGVASRGPARRPVLCNRFEDFVNQFGASTRSSELAGSVSLFFQNGGKRCTIVRLERGTRAEYQAVWKVLPAAVASSEFLILPRVTGAGVEPRERLWASASRLCRATRTLLLVDPPDTWRTASDAVRSVDGLANNLDREFSALFFPPLRDAALTPLISPAGAVAGVLAQQKPWSVAEEPPALRDVRGTTTPLTQQDIDILTKKSINPIRELQKGCVVWGVRTLAGAEGQINDYRYIAVRRLASHIERSILAGTAWAKTERNEQALWSNLQTLAENFLMDLWREQAFQGTTLYEAFYARCGQKTISQTDRNYKNAVIIVGFAPIRPKEFVTFRIPVRTGG
jgi:uncharacterized protein